MSDYYFSLRDEKIICPTCRGRGYGCEKCDGRGYFYVQDVLKRQRKEFDEEKKRKKRQWENRFR